MVSPLPGWERYAFVGPETVTVAIDPTSRRCEVMEGELAGKRFNSPERAALAILTTYPGILTILPSPEELRFPGELWEKVKVSGHTRRTNV